MAQEKYISTATDVTKTTDTVTIETCYVAPAFGDDVYLFIADSNQSVNGVSFLQGYEGVVNNNFDGDFYLDGNGNLIVDSPFADDLEIDSNGDLILTL